MGLLDDAASIVSGRTSHHHGHKKHRKHRSKSRSRSRERERPSLTAQFFGLGGSSDKHHHKHSSAASIFGGDGHHHKHNSSRASFFSLPGGNASRGSFFGLGRSPSYYKRSPRPNFMQRAYKHLKRLLRDLVYYAKRHPVKVFMLIIMPLVTGGALTALLARFGLRMPAGLERMLGIAAKASTGDGLGLVGEAVKMASGGFGHSHVEIERGRNGGMQWERRSVERDGGGGGAGGGWSDGLMGVAKMFL
ncbi:hypothetical protein GQ53DRAFT_719621 [Thozetella sp. PMI_491]|nr:hypothetical protein GQ53DRAFT_719621 [Thozetella sp. PMI_491]